MDYLNLESHSDVLSALTVQQATQLIADLGFEVIHEEDRNSMGLVVFTVSGQPVQLGIAQGGVVILHVEMDLEPDLREVNDWNANNGFARAYLNEDNKLCIDSELPVEGGVRAGLLEGFILGFVEMASETASRFVEESVNKNKRGPERLH
jgi:hypothetical protein